jgi:hypothetical protein
MPGETIVRVLAIVNRVAVARFSRRQEIRVPAAGNRPWFGTEHRPQADPAGAGRPSCHRHQPVDAAALIRPPMLFSALVQELREAVAVQHHVPGAALAVRAERRRIVRKPSGAGRLARLEQRRHRARPHVLRMVPIRGGHGMLCS